MLEFFSPFPASNMSTFLSADIIAEQLVNMGTGEQHKLRPLGAYGYFLRGKIKTSTSRAQFDLISNLPRFLK